MSTYELLAVILLVAAFAGLVDYVRHDGFAVPRTPNRDELGTSYRPRLIR